MILIHRWMELFETLQMLLVLGTRPSHYFYLQRKKKK